MNSSIKDSLYYQALMINTRYTQSDVTLIRSVLSPSENLILDDCLRELNKKHTPSGDIPTHLIRSAYTMIDIAPRKIPELSDSDIIKVPITVTKTQNGKTIPIKYFTHDSREHSYHYQK